jgi:hypothetical protein
MSGMFYGLDVSIPVLPGMRFFESRCATSALPNLPHPYTMELEKSVVGVLVRFRASLLTFSSTCTKYGTNMLSKIVLLHYKLAVFPHHFTE